MATHNELLLVGDTMYDVTFERDDQYYIVTCDALPGLVTEGDDLDDARTMAVDAIECYLGLE